jgi:hypothetical protein
MTDVDRVKSAEEKAYVQNRLFGLRYDITKERTQGLSHIKSPEIVGGKIPGKEDDHRQHLCPVELNL